MAEPEIRECACHLSTDPVQRLVNTPRAPRPIPEAVTFGQFARAGARHGWSIDFLVRLFRGRIDDPRDLFERTFDRRGRHAALVIPYASLLTFYWREVTANRRRRRGAKERPETPMFATSFLPKQGKGCPTPEPA